MRLNRTHLIPVLAIVAGGVIGASLSFSFLGSRSDDVVFVAAPVVVPENVEAPRLEEQTYQYVVRVRAQDIEVERRRIEVEVAPAAFNFAREFPSRSLRSPETPKSRKVRLFPGLPAE